jgi:5-deoxy-D-glucuronate isomerase
MSRLLSRWQQPNAEGCTQSVTPERAGWGHVGFDVYELEEAGADAARCRKSAVWCWWPDALPSALPRRSLAISVSG